MASEAQIAANRRNARKSTGPRTTVGKAVVAQNAITHGLRARQDVILGEDPQEFELHRGQFLEELEPVGKAETVFAEQTVSLSWRLRRAGRLQNEAFDWLLAKELKDSMSGFCDELTPEEEKRLRRDPGLDPRYAVGRMLEKDYRNARVLERLQMYERRIEGSLCRVIKELRTLRLERKDPRRAETQDVASLRRGDGRCAGMSDSAEQSQSEAPQQDRGFAETQDVASLQRGDGRCAGVSDFAKQSQSGVSEADHRQALLDDATHAAASDSAEQSQLIPPARL